MKVTLEGSPQEISEWLGRTPEFQKSLRRPSEMSVRELDEVVEKGVADPPLSEETVSLIREAEEEPSIFEDWDYYHQQTRQEQK